MSGKEAEKEKYGRYFDYHKAARAQIFKRDQSKVTDMQSLVKLMRQGTLCLFLYFFETFFENVSSWANAQMLFFFWELKL